MRCRVPILVVPMLVATIWFSFRDAQGCASMMRTCRRSNDSAEIRPRTSLTRLALECDRPVIVERDPSCSDRDLDENEAGVIGRRAPCLFRLGTQESHDVHDVELAIGHDAEWARRARLACSADVGQVVA